MYRHQTTLRKRHTSAPTEDNSLETPTQQKFKKKINAIRDKLDFEWQRSDNHLREIAG